MENGKTEQQTKRTRNYRSAEVTIEQMFFKGFVLVGLVSI